MRGAMLAGALAAVLAIPAGAEVLAARTLRQGMVLTAPDLRATDGSDIAAFLGLETRRSVYTGRPLGPDDVGPATVVHRNTLVTMEFRRGRLGIRTEGRALDDGGIGEAVRVMNLASRQPVQATVVGQGRVEVTQ